MSMKKLLILAMMLALLLVGCSGIGVWSSGAKTDMQNISKALEPLIGDAQKAVAAAQNNYPFWCAIAQGTLQAAGVKVTPAEVTLAQNWLAVADTTLKIAAPVTTALAAGQPVPPVDTNTLQLAITQAQTVLPNQVKTAMANPAVKALYQAYVAGQTNLPAPAAAAVPTS
jgi:hypothetical protein